MVWQILPGEDIRETARLIYPKTPAARNNLIRAIIRSNPQHFPDGRYQPLAAGTVIHFPDLRTIGAHAKTATSPRKSSTVKKPPKNQPQSTSPVKVVKTGNDLQLTQLIAQLDHEAETESQELGTLIQHIGSLEARLNEFQTLLEAKTPHTSHPQTADDPVTTQTGNSEPMPETITVTKETAQPLEEPGPPTTHTEVESRPEELPLATESIATPETYQQEHVSHEEILASPQADITPQVANINTFDETTDTSLDLITPDNILLIGILLTILIVLVMLRSYRKIRDRHAHASDIVTILDTDERRRYEALFLHQDKNEPETLDHPPAVDDQAIAQTRTLIEQDKTDEAIQALQKQLATSQRNIPGWLLLFELLYKTNNKRDFKKNARRFKRLNLSPDIWAQIQDLGHRLEPNETLYFNEQKRKEKFFPGASAAE